MKDFLFTSALVNILFFIMHELDACKNEEWKMFKFLRVFPEKVQYHIFLYSHIPLFIFFCYYLITVSNLNSFPLWIIVNSISVLHLGIHIVARKWKSNVFTSFTSFLFISLQAFTGLLNLILSGNYLYN